MKQKTALLLLLVLSALLLASPLSAHALPAVTPTYLPTCVPTATSTRAYPTAFLPNVVIGTPNTTQTVAAETATPTVTATVYASSTPWTPSSCGTLEITGALSYPSMPNAIQLSTTLVCDDINDGAIWCHGEVVYQDTSEYGDSAGFVALPVTDKSGYIYIDDRSKAAGGVEWSSGFTYQYHPQMSINGYPDGAGCDTHNINHFWRLDGLYECIIDNGSGLTHLLMGVFCSDVAGTICTNHIDVVYSLVNADMCYVRTGAISGEDCVPPSAVIESEILDFRPPQVVLHNCYTIVPQLDIPIPDAIQELSPIDLPEAVGIPGVELCVYYMYIVMRFANLDIAAALSVTVSIICGLLIVRELRR